jgi:hypothetical protein
MNNHDFEQPEMAPNGPKNGSFLSPRQEAAALALARGGTQDEAGNESGAGTRTIKTWLATQPAFVRRIRELRADMTSRALGRLVVILVQNGPT